MERGRSFKFLGTATLRAIVIASMLFALVPAAQADWWVGYVLEGDNDDADNKPSRLNTATPLGVGEDPLEGTGLIPVWSDGETVTGTSKTATSARLNGVDVTPGDVEYGNPPGSVAPNATQNMIIVHFFEDSGEGAGLAGIQDGKVEVIRIDHYNRISSFDLDSLQFLWGINDTTVAAESTIGDMVGGVVTDWFGQIRGPVHNEIFCSPTVGLDVCDPSFGLPPDEGQDITHNPIGYTIAEAADPDNPQATSMTFFDGYEQMNFEVTLLDGGNATNRLWITGDGRLAFKYYGDKSLIPTLSHWQLGLLGMALVGVAIPVLLRVRPREV